MSHQVHIFSNDFSKLIIIITCKSDKQFGLGADVVSVLAAWTLVTLIQSVSVRFYMIYSEIVIVKLNNHHILTCAVGP